MRIFPNFSEKFEDYPITPYDYVLEFIWDIAKFALYILLVAVIGTSVLTVWTDSVVESLPEWCENIV